MKPRSNLSCMARLITLVGPLTGVMLLAITLGVLGFIAATLIPVLGGVGILAVLNHQDTLPLIFLVAALCALLRGVFRYGEQTCNHYIAFKLLAILRQKVFAALRRLAPAKLDRRDKGDLISVITSDIELLEVFYAHTISPAAIALVMSLLTAAFLAWFHWAYGVLALLAYATVGILLPVLASGRSGDTGNRMRQKAGQLSAFVLDSLRGVDETIQYHGQAQRLGELEGRTDDLSRVQQDMSRITGTNTAVTHTVIWLYDLALLALGLVLLEQGQVNFGGVLIPLITLMSSFGPVVALSNLGATLQSTFAAARRVLDILDETPVVEEVSGQSATRFHGAACEDLTFSYGGETILDGLTLDFPKGKVVGIVGRSGSGKSTLLKLLMRFWDRQSGEVTISERDVRNINTSDLRSMQGYMTQDTDLFHDTILKNILIARPDATREEVEEACKKASIHDFILTLPQGYDTPVGELGDTLSGGERQRLGLARAFLHNAPFLLLDEPTSNLDSLNEAEILRSLHRERDQRTVILVSHRRSTMGIADQVHSVEHGRVS
ncbi:thiol reductant ABC exporter subunit CydC [Pseudoflavonifractor capillosus]|uniref:thiol reductant ABC exporter subunit CydC n=1 Tax=Pseudoflavonifractor capillosus TaxID=106588 RepID=UPI00195E172D|nr:thiol reductant ABC exporter subunit CydC [Pseudoflavonifractor capillosus]MBM6693219.1 thiol reductant ABC exporter subunit CydC [Pseudoflavonifractor capillosus]